jgi:hypothetical protein
MPGPADVAILAKALGKRPAYLMALDDNPLPMDAKEERLLRNWSALPENERMDFFRQIEVRALRYRDPVADREVERHLPRPRAKLKQGTR